MIYVSKVICFNSVIYYRCRKISLEFSKILSHSISFLIVANLFAKTSFTNELSLDLSFMIILMVIGSIQTSSMNVFC